MDKKTKKELKKLFDEKWKCFLSSEKCEYETNHMFILRGNENIFYFLDKSIGKYIKVKCSKKLYDFFLNHTKNQKSDTPVIPGDIYD